MKKFLAVSMMVLASISVAEAKPKRAKSVRQPAYSTSTHCLPKEVKYYLGEVQRRYGKVRIISTFRRGAIIAGTRKRSKHATCQAVDFTVAKNQAQAARWLKTIPNVEVLTYSAPFHHIHLARGTYKGHIGGKKNRRKK